MPKWACAYSYAARPMCVRNSLSVMRRSSAAASAPTSRGGTVAALIRAEALKILMIVGQLGVILATYKAIVPVAFFATFVITVLLFRLALLDRN